MKSFYFFTLLLFLCTLEVFSQTPKTTRQVDGVVIDSTKETIIGAVVTLKSTLDTIITSTNNEGKFSFKNVKATTFNISINSLGYQQTQKNYSFNNTQNQITIPTVTLATSTNILDVVIVDGTSTITYKTDTAEYRASDYIMKENATVEDLVKKMEGMEVDKEGSLSVQGEKVTRARINGKDYFGGDVANALKDLPSDIVDKIQIVDDYGDEATRTGVKDGDPQKVINIVTRADKRVGSRGRFEAGIGSNERYQLTANANRFNGNQQIGIQSSLNNTVTGIANADSGGGNSGGGGRGGNSGGQSGGNQSNNGGGQPGVRQTSRLGFNFNDNLSKKVLLNSSYNFNRSNSKTNSNSTFEEYNKIGTIYGSRNGNSESISTNHSFNAKIEYNIDSANWLIISPTLNFRKNESENKSFLTQTGALKQDQNNTSNNFGSTPNYGLTLNYGHRFNKKGTVISTQLSLNNSDTDQERNAINNIIYYDNLTEEELKDSLLNRRIKTDNLSKNYRGSVTFSHPVTTKSRIEFNGQVNYRGYDNSQITNVIDAAGNSTIIDSLSNVFNYSFTETRVALNYKFTEQKYNFALGITGVPSTLKGYSETRNNHTARNSFNLIPIARFEYKWNRQKRFSLNYNGNPAEPSYEQIQDVPDATNPQNIIVGNPNLKAAFRHTIRANFNNYITATKLNYFAGLNATFNQDQVIRNVVFIPDEFSGRKRETRYTNADGNYSYQGNYGISKRFGENKYSIGLNGDLRYNRSLSMNDNAENIGKSWNFSERLNFQMDPTTWLEINPNIRYSHTKSTFSISENSNNKISTWAFSLSSKVYFIKSLYMTYDFNKNFVKGLDKSVSSNPMIINTSITKDFFKKKTGSLSVRAYDLLNQNNFISRQITENATIDTRSNALSRYFMVNLSYRPQKWSGGSQRGKNSPQNRRGDGSYFMQ